MQLFEIKACVARLFIHAYGLILFIAIAWCRVFPHMHGKLMQLLSEKRGLVADSLSTLYLACVQYQVNYLLIEALER